MTISFCCSRRSRGYAPPVNRVVRNISNPNNDGFEGLKDRLNQAISQNDTQIIRESLLKLINENVYINEPLTPRGSTALMLAAQDGHKDIVALLLEKDADVNLANNNRNAALMFVAQNGHKDIVALLLEKDADVNLANNNRDTALMVAAKNGHKEIVELLLGKGADVNKADKNGCTALMLAAQDGYKDIVVLLLKAGADANKADNYAYTALMIAAQNGHKEIVELLVNKVDDVNKADKNGSTALMLAAQNGHKEIVELLLEKGADVNKVTTDGWTALRLALERGHQDHNNGWTALMLALERGHQDHNNGWTALRLAAAGGHQEIVALLLGKLIKDNIEPIRKPTDNDDVCLISFNNYNDLADPVEFRGKVYELSNLVAWICENNKYSLAQGQKIEFIVPHTNEVVSYQSLNELFPHIKLVKFTQPVD